MKVYFLGIGGIGMSAIALYFHRNGDKVAGYDRTPGPVTESLGKEGIQVHFEDRPDLLEEFTGHDTADTLVIYTPAVPESLNELEHARKNGYRIIKRSRALGEIASGKRCLAVAGTHGKTGTSTLLAHLMTEAGNGCSAFLGGISKNYGSNLLTCRNDIIVAEADEFDRSFLQLFPETAVITSTDADHLDIYGNLASIRRSFSDFASQTSGNLIIRKGIAIDLSAAKAKAWTYGVLEEDGECDFHAYGIRREHDGEFSFSMNLNGTVLEGCRLGIPGKINIENAVAASAAAVLSGADPEKLPAALASFRGVKRRFDVRYRGKCIYIDDYAHHPTELAATIESIKEIYPDRKLTGIFQPHLFTRTRDFADGFAESLSMMDRIILLDIYPARELPIEGISSEMLAEKIHSLSGKTATVVDRNDLLDTVRRESPELLVTFGAGDIDRFAEPLSSMLKEMENV